MEQLLTVETRTGMDVMSCLSFTFHHNPSLFRFRIIISSSDTSFTCGTPLPFVSFFFSITIIDLEIPSRQPEVGEARYGYYKDDQITLIIWIPHFPKEFRS